MAWGDQFEGRRPSFNSRGEVRGFRSRPGAPQADTTQNKGAINSTSSTLAGTSLGNWDAMFRNRITGKNPLASARTPTTGVPHVDSALSQITGTNWGKNNDFNPGSGSPDGTAPAPTAPSKPLDLTTMLNPTHAHSWGASQLTGGQGTPNPIAGTSAGAGGYQTGDPGAILKKFQTPNTATYSYGWGGGSGPSTAG